MSQKEDREKLTSVHPSHIQPTAEALERLDNDIEILTDLDMIFLMARLETRRAKTLEITATQRGPLFSLFEPEDSSSESSSGVTRA